MTHKKPDQQEQDERRRKKALADLAGLSDGAEGLPGTGMGNAFHAAKKRMEALGHEVDDSGSEDDPAERWGKLIGRGLGYLVAAYLIWYLISTYILK